MSKVFPKSISQLSGAAGCPLAEAGDLCLPLLLV